MANPVSSSVDYVKASIQELKKVSWPGRSTVIRHTLIVILAVGVAAGIVALVDAGLAALLKLLLTKGQ